VELNKEKELLLTLNDIILAIIVYIEIPAYEKTKANFYIRTLKTIGGFELNSVQIQTDIWADVAKSSARVTEKREHHKHQRKEKETDIGEEGKTNREAD
jgi:Tfp pilus assembly major pilin PilA